MTNAEVVCVDGVGGVEAVVVRYTRTGRLCAVNTSAFLSCDGSTHAPRARMREIPTVRSPQEFGIRMALGSRPDAIVALMLRQGTAWMAIGLAGGVLGIMVVVRLLRNLLYGVQPFDPIALGGAVAILVVCATIALLIPVHHATRVDPMVALRAE